MKALNNFVAIIKAEAYQAYNELRGEGKPITATSIRSRMLGTNHKAVKLLKFFSEHIEAMCKLLGKDYAPNTLRKYRSTYRRVAEAVRSNGREDINLMDVDYAFIESFDHHLKKTCRLNSAAKHHKILNSILKKAINHGYLNVNPYRNFKIRTSEIQRTALTEDELSKLASLNLIDPQMELVRDIFLTACYTGMAYSDIISIGCDNLSFTEYGEPWLTYVRQKTGTAVNVPLIPPAVALFEKYMAKNKDYKNVFSFITNQAFNKQLKKLGILTGITKNITTHIGRHTFSVTIALLNGASMESLSSMLGHRSIKTTQLYGRVINLKLKNEMAAAIKKYDAINPAVAQMETAID